MKSLLITIVSLLLTTALHAQTTLPLAPFDVVSTTTVSGIRVVFGEGQDWITSVRAYKDTNGYGRLISSSDMYFDPIVSGATVGLDAIRAAINDMHVSGPELIAAGEQLGIDWVTSDGNDELLVVLRAFITRLAQSSGQDTNWVTAVEAALLAEITPPSED